jgi:NAD(P)-dependent dehydrogenase (short-subunit alcohol dehydrogenase family)
MALRVVPDEPPVTIARLPDIGVETARALASAGAEVTLAVRNSWQRGGLDHEACAIAWPPAGS